MVVKVAAACSLPVFLTGCWSFSHWFVRILCRKFICSQWFEGFPRGSDSKESTCNAGDLSLLPGLGRSPGGGHGNPLQCSCLETRHGQRSLVSYIQCMVSQRVGHDWATKAQHSQWFEMPFLLYTKF